MLRLERPDIAAGGILAFRLPVTVVRLKIFC